MIDGIFHIFREVSQTVCMGILDSMEVIYVDRVRTQQILGVTLGWNLEYPQNLSEPTL